MTMTNNRFRLSLSLITRSLLLFHFTAGCYDDPGAVPECFESNEKPMFDEERLLRSFQIGTSGYCASDRLSCLEIWTGYTEEALTQNRSFYASYPFISLIETSPISETSPFSLCHLPERCESPECDCFTTADCEGGSVCVGQAFLADRIYEKRTICLPVCTDESTCERLRGESSHCISENCYLPPL